MPITSSVPEGGVAKNHTEPTDTDLCTPLVPYIVQFFYISMFQHLYVLTHVILILPYYTVP